MSLQNLSSRHVSPCFDGEHGPHAAPQIIFKFSSVPIPARVPDRGVAGELPFVPDAFSRTKFAVTQLIGQPAFAQYYVCPMGHNTTFVLWVTTFI